MIEQIFWFLSWPLFIAVSWFFVQYLVKKGEAANDK
jgi:hypothetical protein